MPKRMQSFGYWLRRRRKALDLTQESLAERVFCSPYSIRKIEADERRPSRALADRLATALAIPQAERSAFLDAARAVNRVDRLSMDGLPSSPAAGAPPLGRSETCADDTPFVGRAEEYTLLCGLIAQLTTGTGHTILLEGEPGIGKSRLMREIARYAEGLGLSVLASSCYEIEQATPYQPITELVLRALDQVSTGALESLAPVSSAELAALVPEFGKQLTNIPRVSNDLLDARHARLLRAVAQLLEIARAGRPSLLIVDDIQWSDQASALVLHYLARQSLIQPMLVIYAYRDENADSDERFAQFLESVRRDAHARRVSLPRLGSADTEQLVIAVAVPGVASAGLVESLQQETEGNPFFLMSILQSMNEGDSGVSAQRSGGVGRLPEALRAAVRARLARVPNEFRSLLETAAVLGRRFDFETLMEVCTEDENQVVAALEWLQRRRLIQEHRDGAYDFSHDKVREVAYREISSARRRLAHQTVAEALERHRARAAPERTMQLAEHFERAQLWQKAIHYQILAAQHSQSLFALTDALRWLDHAIALAEEYPESLDASRRLELYEQRGAVRVQAGQAQGAVDDLRRVIEVLRRQGDHARLRDALVQLGIAYRRADAYPKAKATLTEALTESRATQDEPRTADILYHLGTIAWSNGENSQAIDLHQQAVEICERNDFKDLVAVQAYHGRGESHFASAEPAQAITCLSRSLELARSIGDKSYESENLMMIGYAYTGERGRGDYPRAKAHLEAALEIACAADLEWHMGPTQLGLNHVRACTGSYGDAWTGMTETLSRLKSTKQIRYQLIGHDLLGLLLLDLDLNELALEQLQRGLALGRDTGIGFWQATIAASAAVSRVRLGAREGGEELKGILDQTRRASEGYLAVRCLAALAEISLANGDSSACLEYGDALLELSVRNGLQELEGTAHRWRGEALLAQGCVGEAEVELSRASDRATLVGRVRLQLDTQAALARLCIQRGSPDAARIHSETARKIRGNIESNLAASGLRVGKLTQLAI